MVSALQGSCRSWLVPTAPPAAWAFQGLLGWYLAGHVCCGGTLAAGELTPMAARLYLALASLFALAVTLVACIAARRAWRARPASGCASGPRAFLAFAGLAWATAFGLGLLWASLPAVVLPLCPAPG
jgi:hypothetical protein